MLYSFIFSVFGGILVFIAGYAILNTYEWIRDIDFRLKLVEGAPGLGGMSDVYSMYSFLQPRSEEDAEPQPETTVDVKFEEENLSPGE